MFTGIDIGGTNTDVAVIDSLIQTYKIPNSKGLASALENVASKGRLAISTSQPLNDVLTGPPANIRSIIIPGPGLVYHDAVKGAVSHRGEVVESIDPEEIRSIIKGPNIQGIAISGKFSVRNDSLEQNAFDIASEFFSSEQIATSAPIGALHFPARIITTVLNARIKSKVNSLRKQIQKVNPDFFFVTSTGGLISPERALLNPSLLYHSSPATVANGAYYLTKKADCLIIDIGGTTTELVPLSHGKPIMSGVIMNGSKTLINAVEAKSIPFGGDSCIRDSLLPFRVGNSRSFGGGEPTLTDALNVTGARIGDESRSMVIDKVIAHEVVEQYLGMITSAIREYNPSMIVGTGFLAHYLLSDISERTKIVGEVPEHAGSANAVGAAVSKVSIEVHFHIDSEKKSMAINGKTCPFTMRYDDDDLLEYTKDLTRQMAITEGAPEEDVREVNVLYFSSYDVVRGWRVTGRISDIILGIAPGISVEAL